MPRCRQPRSGDGPAVQAGVRRDRDEPAAQDGSSPDSPLEGRGFEPSVPPQVSAIRTSRIGFRTVRVAIGTQQQTSSLPGCTSYADQDQPDSLQNIRSPTPG